MHRLPKKKMSKEIAKDRVDISNGRYYDYYYVSHYLPSVVTTP
jgi:hypothetical protein